MNETRNEKLQQIGKKVLKESVVRFVWEKTDKKTDERTSMRGSGFFVSPNLVVTNLHCIAGAPSLSVELVSEKKKFPVEGVVAYDVANDLVILAVFGEGVPLQLGVSDKVKIEDRVLAVGYPKGKTSKITQATIQGTRESDKHYQIKPAFKPGQSGGPIVNDQGHVIGVAVAATIGISEFSDGVIASISYAIPASVLQDFLNRVDEVEPLSEWQNRPDIRGFAEGVRGQMKMLEGNYLDAIKCFDTALELNPNLIQIYNNRAGIRLIHGEAKLAIADCNAAIKRKPDFTEAYINRSIANSLIEKHKRAIQDCDIAQKLNPDIAQIYISRGGAKSALGQYEEAIKDYDTAQKLKPKSAEIYLLRATAKWELTDYAGAIEDFDVIIDAYPEFSKNHSVQGSRAIAKNRHGDYKGAIEDYDTILESHPREHVVYFNRGNTKYNLGRSHANKGNRIESRKYYRWAIDDYNEAIKINPDDSTYYYYRGLAKRFLNNFREALRDLNLAILLDPENCRALFQRGLVKRNLGKTKADHGDTIGASTLYQEAIDDYTETIRLNSNYANATTFNNRGYAKYQLSKIIAKNRNREKEREFLKHAIDDYTEAIQLNRKYSLGYINRAKVNYLLGKNESEYGNIKQANNRFQAVIVDMNEYIHLKKGKPNSDAYYYKGLALAALHQYKEAIVGFNETIRKRSKHALAYYNRGLVKQAIEEHEDAKIDFKKAKEIDPEVENKLI